MGAAFRLRSLAILAASCCSVMFYVTGENLDVNGYLKAVHSSQKLQSTFPHPRELPESSALLMEHSSTSTSSQSSLLVPWSFDTTYNTRPFRIELEVNKSFRNPDFISEHHDKFETYFPGIRENFTTALDNYFKRYANNFYSTPEDLSYFRDVSSLYGDTTSSRSQLGIATPEIDWPTIYVTKSSATDMAKKTAHVPLNSASSSFETSSAILSVGVTSFPATTAVDNVIHFYRGELDPVDVEMKMTRDFIRPTPSQKVNLTHTQKSEILKDVVYQSSNRYRTEDIVPSHEFTEQVVNFQTKLYPSVLHEAQGVNKKTPELKSSIGPISVVTIEPVFTTAPIVPKPKMNKTATIHTYSENDITDSVSFIDVHGKKNKTDAETKTSHSDTKPKEETSATIPKSKSCFWNESLCHRQMVNLTLSLTWRDVCSNPGRYVDNLTDKITDNTTSHQLVLVDTESCGGYKSTDSEILLSMYVRNEHGRYDGNLTTRLRKRIHPKCCKQTKLCEKITNYHLEGGDVEITETNSNNRSFYLTHPGVIAGACVSAALCVVVLLGLLRLLRSRSMSASLEQNRSGPRGNSRSGRSSVDAHSLASFTTGNRKRQSRISLRSFLNHAFEDPEMPSRPLNLNNLTNILTNKSLLEEEFKKLPMNMPLPETVPSGAEAKNRYSNVTPIADTRVRLTTVNPRDDVTEYINANHVRGYKGNESEYLACQGPLAETVEDFWRMIWEQQSRMILMLTQLEENGTHRCAPYFPDNTVDCQRVYGDFQVSLQNKDVREHYTMSTLRLYEMEKNLFRDVIHMWYRSWPPHGVPTEHAALLAFLVETRKHSQRTAGPLVVHCSPGTGRTGTVVCLDWCMRQYDECRSVDVPRCVFKVRQDRAGAVQTLEQYVFIHEVLQEYALKMGSQSHRPSIKSFMSFKLSH